MRGMNGIDVLLGDFRQAGRMLRKSPGFAATAAVTLALGIGASTAIFSVTSAVLLRPRPYQNADRLVLVFWENRAVNRKSFTYSNADFFDLRGGTGAIFDGLGGVTSFRAFVPGEDGSAEQIGKALVTANFFRLMGAKIAFGRDFTEADAVPQPAQAEVLIPPGSAVDLDRQGAGDRQFFPADGRQNCLWPRFHGSGRRAPAGPSGGSDSAGQRGDSQL